MTSDSQPDDCSRVVDLLADYLPAELRTTPEAFLEGQISH